MDACFVFRVLETLQYDLREGILIPERRSYHGESSARGVAHRTTNLLRSIVRAVTVLPDYPRKRGWVNPLTPVPGGCEGITFYGRRSRILKEARFLCMIRVMR